MATVPCAAAPTAVIARPAFSKLSLPRRARALALESSATVAASFAISATADTVMFAVAVSVVPFEVTV